jgi:hypothetical protein
MNNNEQFLQAKAIVVTRHYLPFLFWAILYIRNYRLLFIITGLFTVAVTQILQHAIVLCGSTVSVTDI